MLYMLLAMPHAQHGAGMAMPGMGVSPGGQAGFPALAVVLALFMLGYLLWTIDQMATLVRARAALARPSAIPAHLALATVPARRGSEGAPGPAGVATGDQHPVAGRAQFAPGLSAVSKMAMSITMGYMLLLML
jgi:hypothetical protein